MSPNNLQGPPGEPASQGQGPPAEGAIQVQTTPDGGVALAFVQAQPPPQDGTPPAQGQQPFASDEAPRIRLTGITPGDAAVIEFVKAHNAQNPGSPITLAQASEQIRFAQHNVPEAQPPPEDFAGRQAATSTALTSAQESLAQASEAGEHVKVAEWTRVIASLEADAREIARNEVQWRESEVTRAQQTETHQLAVAHKSDFDRLVAQMPSLGDPNSPVCQLFNQKWSEAGNDRVLESSAAPTHILNAVLAQMAAQGQRPGQPQSPANPAARGYPQVPMYPVAPMGAPYAGATRASTPMDTAAQIMAKVEAGELTDSQLNAILRAKVPTAAGRQGYPPEY